MIKQSQLFLILLFTLCSFTLLAQISISDTLVNFGNVQSGSNSTRTILLTNTTTEEIEIIAFHFEENIFQTNLQLITLTPDREFEFEVEFKPKHNIDYTDFLFIAFKDVNEIMSIELTGTGVYEGSYYSSTRNLWGEELKSELRDIIDNHTVLGYNTARDRMYGSIDNKNGSVECVYTGRKATFNTRSGANSSSFNCEHTWPQSFFNENDPMKSDIFHLYPTDVNANGRRSNYDFGIVTSGVTWEEGGSKLGKDSQNRTVFEPRDVHKGNVARTHFYFTVRYNGNYNNYQNSQIMEEIFRDWHLSDEVDQNEEDRNEAIYSYQKNRNPFIDHPEFAERIPKFFGTANYNFEPEISVPLSTINFDTTFQSEATTFKFDIANTGMETLVVNDIYTSDANFSVSYNSDFITAESKMEVRITFAGEASVGEYNSVLTIESDDGDESELKIPLSIYVDQVTSVSKNENLLTEFKLSQNYPNPFNPSTTIKYSIPVLDAFLPANNAVETRAVLKVYDLLGNEIATLINEHKSAGNYEVTFDASSITSGVYYYRLSAGDFVETKKMLLVK